MQMHTLQTPATRSPVLHPILSPVLDATLDASLDIPQTSPSIPAHTATAAGTRAATSEATKVDGHHRPAGQGCQLRELQPQRQRLNRFTTPRLTGHRNQCGACLQAFGGNHGFTLHRIGAFGVDRRCMSPAELKASGMHQDSQGFWRLPDAPRRRNVRP